uniref:Small ribosomal subunit protein uS4c n=2 Tax=Bryopsidineae TaxID=2791029 RepID=A0A0D6E1E2_BRYPL|nr:30S ribosomal protein S4 [Bryopsis plumosa]AJF21956.1 ribosomal protein S4 [Codium decorticatum]CEO91029.1 30S ribosomal protein S4 [Bryopsis plumosa]
MSRYRGPKLKITRRLGVLPGLTSKVSNKKNPPGQHGRQNTKPSQYAIRLLEKQKLRYNYGVSEKQLFSYLKKARKNSRSTAQVLLELLEMRLDNILYRLGFAKTINSGRQLITHQHIRVNQKKVTIPSYQCKINDIIEFSPNSMIQKKNLMNLDLSNIPSFLSIEKTKMSAQIKNIIPRSDVLIELNELLVIEYYSKT